LSIISQDDVNNDVLMLTVNAFTHAYNVKTVYKTVIRFFENLYYRKSAV